MVSGESDRALLQRRARSLALLGALMLALHVGLIDGIGSRWQGSIEFPSATAMEVRMLLPAVPQAGLPVAPVVPLAPAPKPAPALADLAPQVAKVEPPARAAQVSEAAPAVIPSTTPMAGAAVTAPASDPKAQPQPQATPTREALLAFDPDEPLPEPGANVMPYATRADGSSGPLLVSLSADAAAVPPPAVTLGYELHRGLLRGSAELRWEPHDGSYELNFEARVAGFIVLRQMSMGDLGASGLAPRRFTDQRAGREVRAANFQREAGKITFSGPSIEMPLIPGVQDRLSWMVQLAAFVAADPRRGEAGGEVMMAVVGVRGDLAAWVFRSVGPETVETALGPVQAIKFVRQSPDPYDTQVDVWLDPARHHLPVRATLHNGPDDTLDLVLRQSP